MTHSNDLKSKLKATLVNPGAASSDFDLNKDVLPPETQLKAAAVLIAFMVRSDQVEIVLTKRSSSLKHHPGQVAFPGGKHDKTDADLQATALREAEEEIRLPSQSVEIVGTLPPHQTVTGFQVTPYVGWIAQPVVFEKEAGEVAEVFSVPANHLLEIPNYRVEGRIWQRKMRKYYTVPYGPYYIWGATARMLRALADQVAS